MEFARRGSQNDFGIGPLTGALLPTKFNEILAREIMFSKRANTAISIITISISKIAQENFKKISNDKDLLIDEFMVQMVFELRKILRKTDCICRINATRLWLLITNPPSSTRFPEVDQNVLINRVKALAAIQNVQPRALMQATSNAQLQDEYQKAEVDPRRKKFIPGLENLS